DYLSLVHRGFCSRGRRKPLLSICANQLPQKRSLSSACRSKKQRTTIFGVFGAWQWQYRVANCPEVGLLWLHTVEENFHHAAVEPTLSLRFCRQVPEKLLGQHLVELIPKITSLSIVSRSEPLADPETGSAGMG